MGEIPQCSALRLIKRLPGSFWEYTQAIHSKDFQLEYLVNQELMGDLAIPLYIATQDYTNKKRSECKPLPRQLVLWAVFTFNIIVYSLSFL